VCTIAYYHNELDLSNAENMINSIRNKFKNDMRNEKDINKFQRMEHDLLYQYKNQLLCREEAFNKATKIINRVLTTNINNPKGKYQILLHASPGLGKSAFINALLDYYSNNSNNSNNNNNKQFLPVLVTFSKNSSTFLNANEYMHYRQLYHAFLIRIIFKLCFFLF